MANKTEFAKALQTKVEKVSKQKEKEFTLNKGQTDIIVESFWETITDFLSSGEVVDFRGTCKFEIRERSARKGRNPQTGEEIQIPASQGVGVKVGKQLKEAVK